MTIEADVVTQARDFRTAIDQWAKTYRAVGSRAPKSGNSTVDATLALRLWSSSYVHPAGDENHAAAR